LEATAEGNSYQLLNMRTLLLAGANDHYYTPPPPLPPNTKPTIQPPDHLPALDRWAPANRLQPL